MSGRERFQTAISTGRKIAALDRGPKAEAPNLVLTERQFLLLGSLRRPAFDRLMMGKELKEAVWRIRPEQALLVCL